MITSSTKQFGKRYLFHLKTTYSRKKKKIEDFFYYARRENYSSLIFTDSIGQKEDNIIQQYADEISFYSQKTGIKAFVGIEAKMTSSGIAITKKAYEICDVLCVNANSFSGDLIQYISAFSKMIQKYKNKTRVWVYPGGWLAHKNILTENLLIYMSLLKFAVNEGWFIEETPNLPPQFLKKTVPSKFRIQSFLLQNKIPSFFI